VKTPCYIKKARKKMKYRVIGYTSDEVTVEAKNEQEATRKAIAEFNFYPDYCECYEEESEEEE
jgi:hypothetical protein